MQPRLLVISHSFFPSSSLTSARHGGAQGFKLVHPCSRLCIPSGISNTTRGKISLQRDEVCDEREAGRRYSRCSSPPPSLPHHVLSARATRFESRLLPPPALVVEKRLLDPAIIKLIFDQMASPSILSFHGDGATARRYIRFPTVYKTRRY